MRMAITFPRKPRDDGNYITSDGCSTVITPSQSLTAQPRKRLQGGGTGSGPAAQYGGPDEVGVMEKLEADLDHDEPDDAPLQPMGMPLGERDPHQLRHLAPAPGPRSGAMASGRVPAPKTTRHSDRK